MKTYQKIVECFAVLADPSKPDRKPAFDLHVVTMIDLEDGTPQFADPRAPVRVLNMQQAKAEGLDLPEIAAAFDTDASLALVKERKEKEEALARAASAEAELASVEKRLSEVSELTAPIITPKSRQ